MGMMILMIPILFSACAHPLMGANPDQLKQYPTDQLSNFEGKYGKGSVPGVSNELARRQREDIDYLMSNATSLEDFEYHRYPSQTETIASKISKKYSGYPMASDMFNDARRQWYVKTYPDISDEVRECILKSKSSHDHKLKIGMLKGHVVAAIGLPDDVNSSIGSWGVREQWVYGGMIGNRYFPVKYFYFSDGKLTVMQN